MTPAAWVMSWPDRHEQLGRMRAPFLCHPAPSLKSDQQENFKLTLQYSLQL